MYRDKYRRLNDILWKPKPKKTRMVDLDSDADEAPVADGTPDAGQASTSPKEVVPREVLRIRAANMLNMTRFC